MDGLQLANVAALRNKLQLNNVFTIADREIENGSVLFSSLRLLPSRTVYLVEITFDALRQACTIAARSSNMIYAKSVQAALAAILRDGR